MSGKATSYNTNSVDVNQLDATTGWGKWSWRMHRNKANMIFILLLAAIIGLLVVIGFMWKDQCSTRKEMTAILIGTDVVLIIATYMLVWNHTKWTKPSNSDSQFTGEKAMIRNQQLQQRQQISTTGVAL